MTIIFIFLYFVLFHICPAIFLYKLQHSIIAEYHANNQYSIDYYNKYKNFPDINIFSLIRYIKENKSIFYPALDYDVAWVLLLLFGPSYIIIYYFGVFLTAVLELISSKFEKQQEEQFLKIVKANQDKKDIVNDSSHGESL